MRMRHSVAVLCVLGFSATSAPAQYHAECWYRQKSGYRVTGAQPSTAQIFATMKSVAQANGIPVEIVAAVAYNESNWTQFASDGYVLHNREACIALYRDPAARTNPPDVGLMELAGETAKQYDIPRLISDYAYNLESGIKVLLGKWDNYHKSIGPAYYPGRPFDHDKMVIENWYYPLKSYNGWANLADFAYTERIFGYMENTPARYSDHVWAVRPTRPAEAIPGYSLPPAAGKFITYFKAFHPEQKFRDGNGADHAAATHRGTFGESTPAGSTVAISPAAYRVNVSSTTVRGGPGTAYPLKGTLSSGAIYVANARHVNGTWVRVWFRENTAGWIQTSSLAPTAATAVRFTNDYMNVRSGPASTYGRVGYGYAGEMYVRISTTDGFHKIWWGGTTAWVGGSVAPTVSLGGPPPPSTSTFPAAYRCNVASMNVRGGPGTTYSILGKLASGMTYAADAKDASGQWLRIWFNGGYGWCFADYLTKATGVTGVKISLGELNVRSGPSTSYTILGKVHSPEIYIRVGTATGWNQINWNGGTGWVSASYSTTISF